MQNTRHRKTYLYRYFDADGILLYVGITRSISKRHAQHETYSLWFKEHTKITVEIFPSQYDAATAEKRAIANEKPKHNISTGGALGGAAFDTVIVSMRLPHDEAVAFDKVIKAQSTTRTEVLRELVKTFTAGHS